MNTKQEIKIAVDAIVFGYNDKSLNVLLIKQKFGLEKNNWVLPGGFVHNNENLEQAVLRELKEETGILPNYIEQLYTFGNVERDKRYRVVSVSYMCLINPKKFDIIPDTDALEVSWFDIQNLPKLGYDHNQIIDFAIERLRSKIKYMPIGLELLEKKFPFSDLENLYTTILDKNIDRRNFRKKFLNFNLLIETKEYLFQNVGRPALLYKFDTKVYKQLLNEGFYFDFKFT
ncbi:MAG: NUDIX domain-containing protein [Chitinophagales bacterium]